MRTSSWFVRSLFGLAWLLFAGAAWPGANPADAGALRAQFERISQQGAGKIFDRPIYLQSNEASGQLQGDVYASIDHPFADLPDALDQPAQWCQILILHLNVKYCRAAPAGGKPALDVGLGRKFDQPLSDVYWVRFDFAVVARSADFLSVSLHAPSGPLGTKEFRITLQAAALDAARSVLHMSYSYGFGLSAKLAMQAYLSTIGSDKVGFSVTGNEGGHPQYVGGVRGVLERNTIRYYLAIDTYLATLDAPPASRFEQRMKRWFDDTERYPEQLHEVDWTAYHAMKLHERKRQQDELPPADAG